MNRCRIGNGLLVMLIAWGANLAGCATAWWTPNNSAAPVSRVPHRCVSLRDSLDPLNKWFNAERGKPRFLTILSPT